MNNNISIRDRNRLYHYLPDDDYNFIARRIMLEILKEKAPNMLDDKMTREKIYDRIVRKYRYDLPPSILEKIYNSVLKDKNFEKELKDSWEYKIYDYMKKCMDTVEKRNPGETEFHQAVKEVLESLEPVIIKEKKHKCKSQYHRFKFSYF